jgi:hypothetical protein
MSRSTVRPRRFSRPRRLAPLSTSRVYFTPQPRPGFTFQGFAPAAKPRHLVGGRCPLAVSRPSPTVELPRRRRPRPRRLQGFDPGSSSRTPTGCLALATPRSPPRFQLPRVLLRIPWGRLHAPSAHDLGRQTLRVNLAVGLQRIDQYPTWYSVPRLPFPFELCGLLWRTRRGEMRRVRPGCQCDPLRPPNSRDDLHCSCHADALANCATSGGPHLARMSPLRSRLVDNLRSTCDPPPWGEWAQTTCPVDVLFLDTPTVGESGVVD